MDATEMRRNGDTEQSVAYWATQVLYWDGTPVLVLAPPKNPPADCTGD